MGNVSDIYTLWLKPWHLPVGKPVEVTIQKVEVRTLHPRPTETEDKLVLSFVGQSRRLILNDGNANKMTDIGGEDWAAWQGLVIQLKRQKFTKDKETIAILPSSALGVSAEIKQVDAPAQSAKTNGISASHPDGGGGNGHTDKPADRPYKFPSGAAEKFYRQVQQATGDFYGNVPELIEVIGGWFNFGLPDLWDEKLSMAVDHARMRREAAQEPVVESQDEKEPG